MRAGSPPHSGCSRRRRGQGSARKSRTAGLLPSRTSARSKRASADRPRHASGTASASHTSGMLVRTPKGALNPRMARRQGRHGDVMHEWKPTAPARRLQKIDPEIEPEITQTEELPRNLPVSGQLVVPAEFERIIESQGIVEHQPQPDEHDRAGRRQQRSPHLSAAHATPEPPAPAG